MQNTKIQALWKLCQELKTRREILVDKMNQNQAYLDEQQWAMSEEVNQLKQENKHLFSQVQILIEQVYQFKEQLQQHHPQAAVHSEPSFDNETLNALHERYTAIANQLDVSDSLYQSRSALLEQLQKNSQNVHYEFKALKEANQSLSQDLEALKSKSDQLIELVENYRQAALEAYAEIEKIQEQNQDVSQQAAEQTESEAESEVTSTAESTEVFDSKAEAARDAVRKKTVILLRHRLGKVPRDVSSALKEISNSKTMDQLFEQALSVQSIEEFSTHLSQ